MVARSRVVMNDSSPVNPVVDFRSPHVPTAKLLLALRKMLRLLDERWRDYYIHANVVQFYYMETSEEISFLEMKVKSGSLALMPALEERKLEAFNQWRKDYRWLCRYLMRSRL